MDKGTFEKILNTPSDISGEEAILLEELVQEFPYCQMAHLLIANESYQKKSMHYPKKLKRASTYVLDRTVLHSLLNPKETTSKNIDVNHEITENNKVENNSPEINLANQANIELLNELETNIKDLKIKKEGLVKNTVAEQNHLRITHVFSKIIIADSKPESRLGEELTNNNENLDLLINYLHFKDRGTVNPNEQIKIIDMFIKAQPRINPRTNPGLIEPEIVDLSMPSSELKLELITENFALILTKQNKIEKAIEVYKKLMLKYPDKSAYFAAKLNELETR